MTVVTRLMYDGKVTKTLIGLVLINFGFVLGFTLGSAWLCANNANETCVDWKEPESGTQLAK